MRQAILLIDHGSRLDAANRVLHEVAALVSARVGPEVLVACAHMELAEPTVAQGIAACVDWGAELLLVQPYMLAPGRHVSEDIPRLVHEAAAGYAQLAIRFGAALGVHPALVEVILDRCRG